jgi:hypothetical protein
LNGIGRAGKWELRGKGRLQRHKNLNPAADQGVSPAFPFPVIQYLENEIFLPASSFFIDSFLILGKSNARTRSPKPSNPESTMKTEIAFILDRSGSLGSMTHAARSLLRRRFFRPAQDAASKINNRAFLL